MPSDSPGLPAGCEILVVEDDGALRRRLAAHLAGRGAAVTEAGNLAEARRLARGIRFDFVAMDLHLPDGEGLELLRERTFSENAGVVVMTAFGGVKKAVEAMRLGADDYLAKPFEPDEVVLAFLRSRASRAAGRREEHAAGPSEDLFFGASLGAVRASLDAILAAEHRLERSLPPVLIEGETGTGKTALARWLHRHGPRAGRPFIAVNCAALPDNLAESELFGHERGAFTDARQAKIGLCEAADGGTLFHDELGSLSPASQAKVLTAVEDRTLRRVGATKELAVDVHVVAASNVPLGELAAAGRFRPDLHHRLDLLRLRLPPLRERGTDLVPLARSLLERIAARHRLKPPAISAAGESRLLAQKWPGNVRELAHEIERALIFGGDGPLEFPHLGGASAPPPGWRNPAWRLPPEGFTLDEVVVDLIAEALRETENNVSAAARRLGVTREFLRYRLRGEKAGSA